MQARVVEAVRAELQAELGISLRWYDVLVHLDDTQETGIQTNDLAGRILHPARAG